MRKKNATHSIRRARPYSHRRRKTELSKTQQKIILAAISARHNMAGVPFMYVERTTTTTTVLRSAAPLYSSTCYAVWDAALHYFLFFE